MWIADTTASDGIAIMAFATVLFLILFGIVSLAKWILRLLSGKPNPARMETVVLVLECKEFKDDEGDESGFPNPYADSPTSSALMYVLLIVFALFGLILFLI